MTRDQEHRKPVAEPEASSGDAPAEDGRDPGVYPECSCPYPEERCPACTSDLDPDVASEIIKTSIEGPICRDMRLAFIGQLRAALRRIAELEEALGEACGDMPNGAQHDRLYGVLARKSRKATP